MKLWFWNKVFYFIHPIYWRIREKYLWEYDRSDYCEQDFDSRMAEAELDQ